MENSIDVIYSRFEQLAASESSLPVLNRQQHTFYIETNLRRLSSAFECLDASRPWMVYWLLNAASLMNLQLEPSLYHDIVDFLRRCRSPSGGFGGGPGQEAHLAPTYAAVNALAIVGTEEAYEAMDKNSLKRFFLKVKEDNGAYKMHDGGEVDVRGAYCAISAGKLCNFCPEDEAILFKNTAQWIAACQTYEGGFGGAPGLEAHGGYSFCAAAALAMLGTTAACDLHGLLRWVVNRQMQFEGGFQGRTNKLVDGCYSFWQGALIPIVQALIVKEEPDLRAFMKSPLFHREALQEYILICCQRPTGGLIDKPGKPADPYHTCYTISGLSVAQHCNIERPPLVIGALSNELLPTHPIHNIPPKCALKSYMYFRTDDGDRLCSNDGLSNDQTHSDVPLQNSNQSRESAFGVGPISSSQVE